MKLDLETISWIEKAVMEVCIGTGHGNVGVILHIKQGKIDWTEKIKRETEKPVYRTLKHWET